MTLVTRRDGSGLFVAEEQASDVVALTRVLQREVRPDVAIQEREGAFKIVHVRSGEVMATWADDYGNPLPLSSGIVEWFKRRQVGARNQPIDADEHNRRHLEQLEREREARVQGVRDAHKQRLDDVLQVSMAGRFRPRKRGASLDGPRAGERWKRRP